jgi:hypothetical protein
MSMMTDPPAGWESRPCRGMSLELFYGPPEAGDGPGGYDEPPDQRRWRERRAKQVCQACPFRPLCLASELKLPAHQQWGVRGGLTARERRALLWARIRRAAAS